MPRIFRRRKLRSRAYPYRRRSVAVTKSYVDRRVRRVYRMAAPEKKYFDVDSSGQSASSTMSFVLLNPIVTGSDSNTREGQTINMLGSELRLDLTANSSSVTSVVRYMLIYDSQSNGAAFTAGSLLEVANNLNSPYRVGYRRRFHVLLNKFVPVSLNGSNYQVSRRWFPRYFKKTQFNEGAGAGNISDILTGSLYFCVISDQATDAPTYSYYHRLWFTG